ncbi:hypothetical protein EDI_037800 [Entamoeba dispar SAW760]|uniref:Uncharacterized protein n=1 Tax=Entamoeba dispar (strain ATCC PRA-260 / SAW760) TaxID=370354 RepID=B0ERI3_ENTDS|nr:uncharacterized protein EDI_037800 [Entamoeba dispar SAW760]EDR22841.1 hypothetical protein EDI_037800 [Entamoeba dispar SAW760]|eukprot:EDR22841.1 hypothetical protein EDI_037800 [Entamoeba dispar SAW760]
MMFTLLLLCGYTLAINYCDYDATGRFYAGTNECPQTNGVNYEYRKMTITDVPYETIILEDVDLNIFFGTNDTSFTPKNVIIKKSKTFSNMKYSFVNGISTITLDGIFEHNTINSYDIQDITFHILDFKATFVNKDDSKYIKVIKNGPTNQLNTITFKGLFNVNPITFTVNACDYVMTGNDITLEDQSHVYKLECDNQIKYFYCEGVSHVEPQCLDNQEKVLIDISVNDVFTIYGSSIQTIVSNSNASTIKINSANDKSENVLISLQPHSYNLRVINKESTVYASKIIDGTVQFSQSTTWKITTDALIDSILVDEKDLIVVGMNGKKINNNNGVYSVGINGQCEAAQIGKEFKCISDESLSDNSSENSETSLSNDSSSISESSENVDSESHFSDNSSESGDNESSLSNDSFSSYEPESSETSSSHGSTETSSETSKTQSSESNSMTNNSDDSNNNTDNDGLSGGAIFAIVLALLIVLIIIIIIIGVLVYFFIFKPKKQSTYTGI